MANILVERSSLENIADAIRKKNGTENTYKPSEMPQGIDEVYNAGYEQGKAEGSEFIGVKYSDFSGGYSTPKIADATSFAAVLDDNSQVYSNRMLISVSLFANVSRNVNGGLNSCLETVYLPDGLTELTRTFEYCTKLKYIYGDLSHVKDINVAFDNCGSLNEIPYMPNLRTMGNFSFRNCIGLTSITFYKVLTTWHTGALTGCTNIETINLVDGWNTSIYAQHCPKLTSECVDNMINCLADMTGSNAPTIQFHANVKAKLTDEQIATITGKNWTLA